MFHVVLVNLYSFVSASLFMGRGKAREFKSVHNYWDNYYKIFKIFVCHVKQTKVDRSIAIENGSIANFPTFVCASLTQFKPIWKVNSTCIPSDCIWLPLKIKLIQLFTLWYCSNNPIEQISVIDFSELICSF